MNHLEAFRRVKTNHLSHALIYPLSSLQRGIYPAGLDCDLHASGFFHVVLLELGSMVFQEEHGRELECKAGSVVAIPIECRYRWTVREESVLLMCLHHGFTFKEHGGLAMLFGFSQRNLCHINLGRDYGNEFSRQIDAAAKTRFADVRRSTLILDFLAMTLEHSGLTPYDEPGADAPDVIAAVLYYIEQNLQRNITLKELAQRAFLCESRFSRVFRARTGLAPLQYIAKRKTSRAVAALKNTNIPAGEIGAVLGFNSLNYFSRFIKKNTGKSPSQIRESRSNTIR